MLHVYHDIILSFVHSNTYDKTASIHSKRRLKGLYVKTIIFALLRWTVTDFLFMSCLYFPHFQVANIMLPSPNFLEQPYDISWGGKV